MLFTVLRLPQMTFFYGFFVKALKIFIAIGMLKERCHAFPVITRPLVCYEGFYACKRCAESKPSKYTM